MGADELGEPPVAEREREHDAVRRDAAPALGQVPERQQEPVVDALVMGDRERDREVVRTARAAAEELDAELRERRDALDDAVVEHREPHRIEHVPADLGADVRARRVPRPGPHHVAVADQLDAAAPEHVDRAAEQAVDEQEALVVHVDLERLRRVPRAGRERLDARDRLAPRALHLCGRYDVREVRVGVDESDRVGHRRFSYADVACTSMACLEIARTPLGGALCVAVTGELDLAGAPALQHALDAAVRESDGVLLVDLCRPRLHRLDGLTALLRTRALLGREDRGWR